MIELLHTIILLLYMDLQTRIKGIYNTHFPDSSLNVICVYSFMFSSVNIGVRLLLD